MKKSVRFWLISLIAAFALALSACGGDAEAPAEEAPAEEMEEGEDMDMEDGDDMEEGEDEGSVEEGGEAAAGEASTDLTIAAAGEQLLFDQDALGPVPAGEEISVVFDNVSNINQHNWILLDTSDSAEAAAFNEAAAAAGPEAQYLPEDMALAVAAGELLDPGTEETISFTAPAAPGEYLYICTVPGHYVAGMVGTLTVVE